MKIKAKLICAFCVLIFLLSCSACSNKGTALDLYYFNTAIHIETYSTNISKSTLQELKDSFSQIDKTFDINNEDSFVQKFNSANANDKIATDIHVKAVIEDCLELYAFTNGKFNPTVYPLLALWQFTPEYPVIDFSLPSESQILQLLGDNLKFDEISFDSQNNLIKPVGDMKIDLSGIVKGYATDLAYEILNKNGHTDGYVNVGGSSLKLLKVNSLNVTHPRPTDNFSNILSINLKDSKNLSVSTSGDYQRYYVKDGVRYSHLIDPTTGSPSKTNVVSVTVIGANGALGDAITTAACLTPHDVTNVQNSQLATFLNKVVDELNCSVFAVYDDGKDKQVLTNEKQNEVFTLLDDSYEIVNI